MVKETIKDCYEIAYNKMTSYKEQRRKKAIILSLYFTTISTLGIFFVFIIMANMVFTDELAAFMYALGGALFLMPFLALLMQGGVLKYEYV